MTCPVAAELLEQLFPVDAGTDPETFRRQTLKVGETLAERDAIRPETAAPAIAVTLDSTFVRSCEDGERHLEVRVGNVETKAGGRQVFGAVAKADTRPSQTWGIMPRGGRDDRRGLRRRRDRVRGCHSSPRIEP